MSPFLFSPPTTTTNKNIEITTKQLPQMTPKIIILRENQIKLITSHEEIQKNNKINQTINKVTKKLQKLFTISTYTTLPKTKKSLSPCHAPQTLLRNPP